MRSIIVSEYPRYSSLGMTAIRLPAAKMASAIFHKAGPHWAPHGLVISDAARVYARVADGADVNHCCHAGVSTFLVCDAWIFCGHRQAP